MDEALGREVNDRLLDLAARIGIYRGRLDELRACDYGRYAMLVHPDVDDPERLLVAALGFAAEFAVDDEYCDDEREGSDPRVLGRRLGIAQAVVDPVHILGEGWTGPLEQARRTDPVLVGLAAYLERVAQYATAGQLERVRYSLVAMFLAMNWEGSLRITGQIPPVGEYLATRHPNSFAPCMTLIDVLGGYEVPAQVYALPEVKRATMLAAMASIILNDIYSAAREQATELADGGLPDLIAAETGCSPQQALDRTIALHDEYVHTFEDESARVAAAIPLPQLWRYLAGLSGWLGGNHEYHRGAGRYSLKS